MTEAFERAIRDWQRTDPEAAGSLAAARTAAHWAVQTIAAAGRALADPRPDDSHTGATFDVEHRRFVGATLAGGARVGVELESLTQVVLDAAGEVAAREPLAGRTLDRAYAWAADAVARVTGSDPGASLRTPEYDLPDHAVRDGAAFPEPDPGLSELANAYANAARLAGAVSDGTLGASPVRCWPHHFDIATLVTLDPPGGDPEKARSIGFGLSPGDGSYAEPYWYVNPWPAPAAPANVGAGLDGGGHWHRKGWFGAVLPASRLPTGDAEEQGRAVYAFARSAFAAERALLGAL